MPNFSGIWTVTQQMQAKGASTWPAVPGAPTIGTATAGGVNCASVTFTPPACTGYPAGVTGYRVISTPGCFTQTGASSPLVVTGLTNGSSYTFRAQATNAIGYGALSAASNSITAALVTCTTFTTPGSFTWVAPSGVTSVAVLAVGGAGFAGGGLGYKNAQAVTPGSSYSVVVGNTFCSTGGDSYFISTGTVKGGGSTQSGATQVGGTYTGDGGGNGGNAYNVCGYITGGGGAGGYAGAGGAAANGNTVGNAGSGGGGGGGRGAGGLGACYYFRTGGGGGVGLFGQGASGAGGTLSSTTYGVPGSGGSGGANGGVDTGSGARGYGGAYGGGHAGSNGGVGSTGAVRIVWAGGARGTPSFPSTCVGA